MKLRILTLPFDPEVGRFDDAPVRELLADKELLGLQDHFFVYQGQPHLTVVLTYRSGAPAAVATSSGKKSTRRESWRDLLDSTQIPLFNTLREWRGQKAKDEGVPPYVICTNLQLAEVVCARPQTLNKLSEIEGFGTAKLKRYGEAIVAFFQASEDNEPSGTQEEERHD